MQQLLSFIVGFFNRNGCIHLHHTHHNHATVSRCLGPLWHNASPASEERRGLDAQAAPVGRGESGCEGMARARLHRWWVRLQTEIAMGIEQNMTCVSLAT